MAANLGQSFLGASGIVPTLVQELAVGNFHDSRETFHDYIYSKLILGDNKSTIAGVPAPNPPVFPNTNLASSYPNPLPIVSGLYNQGLNHSSGHILMDGNSGGDDGGTGNKAFSSPVTKAGNSHKSSNSKKKPSHVQQNLSQQVSTGSSEGLTKIVKKSHHKKKDKTNVCNVCGRGFAEKYTLNRHMLTHTHVRPYSCTKCNMSFSRSDGLAKHMATPHRRIDAHHCDVCGGTFNSEVSFEQHRREYGNTLPFVCNLCMLAFSQCCHLNYHMKSHSLSKLNDSLVHGDLDDKKNAIDVSDLIPEDFSPTKKETSKSPLSVNSSVLANIIKTGHAMRKNEDHSAGVLDPGVIIKPEVEEYLACQAASHAARSNASKGSNLGHSSFDSVSNFSLVSSSHSMSQDGKYSQARQSGRNVSAVAPTYLSDTSDTGSLVPTSSGDVIPISDTEMKKYLDIKIPNPRLHDSELTQGGSVNEDGLFRCEICGKGFTRKYHMQRHVKLHIRGPVPKAHLLDWTRRPYACGVCKMGFTRQHHLTRHMLIHTGERPHSCHECGKAFRRYTNLTLHVRTVHGAERPFKCQICGRGFPRLYSLQRHLKLHAKMVQGLTSESVDLLYSGFQPVDVVNMNLLKDMKSYRSSIDLNSTQRSSSQESASSELSDISDRYDQESSEAEDSMDHINPDGNDSPVSNRDGYTLLRNDSGETGFRSESERQGHSADRGTSSHPRHIDDRLGQQTRPVSTSEYQIQSKGHTNLNNVNMQNSIQPSDEFNSSQHSTKSMRSQTQPPVTAASDYNQRLPMTTTSSEMFVPVAAMLAENLRTSDVSADRSFTDLKSANFSLSQRSDSGDGFMQRIQSPHPLLNCLERPGSQSMVSQACGPDTIIQTPAGYIQASSLMPPCSSMDQAANHGVEIHNPRVYSRHLQDINLGEERSGEAEVRVYSQGHVSFSEDVHGGYQQQLSDDLNH